jgi:hypothetical protein
MKQDIWVPAGEPADYGAGPDQRDQNEGSETEREGDALAQA